MKFAKLLPYLLLVVAGALSVPTIMAAFTGEPSNRVLVTLSSALLVLALLCLPYSQRSVVGSRPSNA
jgi:hypothetical protein